MKPKLERRNFVKDLSLIFLSPDPILSMLLSREKNNQHLFMQIQSDVGIHVGWVQTFNPFVGENKNVILKEVFESISSTFMKKTIIINTLLFNNFMELPGFIVIKIIEYARKYDTFVYVIVNENIEKVSYEQLKNAGAMLMLTASPEDVQQKSFFRLLAGAIAGNELEKNLQTKLNLQTTN